MKNEVKLINPLELETTAGTQARVSINQSTVDEYAECLKNGDLFPNPVVFAEEGSQRYILADGFHTRLAWIAIFNDKPIPCDVREGKIWDAKIYAAGANATHGQRRTPKDIEKAIRMLLLDANSDGWADTIIADIAKCCRKTVAKVRETMICNGELDGDTSQKRKYMRDGKLVEVTVPPKNGRKQASGQKAPTAKDAPNTVTQKSQDDFDRNAIIEAIGTVNNAVCSGAEALERYTLDDQIEDAERAANWLDDLVSSAPGEELSESEKAFLRVV